MNSSGVEGMSGPGEVKVTKQRGGAQIVAFPYHPLAAQRMARIAGAEYKQDQGGWVVPPAVKEFVTKAVEDIDEILKKDFVGRLEVESLARKSAEAELHQRGTPKAAVRISTYHDRERAHAGEILNVNGHYAAQLTGFGRDDGAAFITLHRLADLGGPVFKGDRVAIRYNDKGKAGVEAMVPDFYDNMGREADGIKVVEDGQNFKIYFDFNPDIAARINRVADVEFNTGERCFEVPKAHEEFVRRAVNDMRAEFVKYQASEKEMRDAAKARLDGAKVVAPLVKGGPPHSGTIVAQNDRHVLQHTGRENFTLHNKNALDRGVANNESVKITYQNGRGTVSTPTRAKEVGHGR